MEKEKLPLISFIVPVYHDEHMIEACADSILDQDYPNIELIMSVDGCEKSQIVVQKIVKKYKDSGRRVEAIYAPTNRGACIARNEGAKIAKGQYFSFLPADAVLYPGMARVWMTHLTEYPEYDFLYGGYKFLDQILTKEDVQAVAKENSLTLKEYEEKSGIEKNADGTYKGHAGFDYLSEPFDPYFLEGHNYIDGSFPLKADMFWKAGGWDSKIKSLQDWDLWLSVVKAGGKGIFVRDIFFETQYPHKGGLSDDSSRNWLERTGAIKAKHGIPQRKICVSSLGAPFHGKRMAYLLHADYHEMPSYKPHKYDMIYQIGFFPSIADLSGQVFAGCEGKRVIHWIGTDIWQMQQMDVHHRNILMSFFENNIDYHLCEAEFTQKELKQMGIEAQIVPLPPHTFPKVSPLPAKPTIAVYQPENNKSFYLPDLCKEIADLCPDITFKFFGDNSSIGKINNIHYVGYVQNMQEFINDCHGILRLTVHDGLPISVCEFILAGRHAVVSVPMPFTTQAKNLDARTIAAQIKRLAQQPLNKQGVEYYETLLSHKKYKTTIEKLLKYNPKEYWEKRALEWSKQADRNYSLPEEDKKIIQKWLKDIDFKTVLDIGCGNGRMVEWFEGKEYMGIDISKKLIEISKERYSNRKFQVKKVEDLDEGKFDLIFSYTTLEHITPEEWPKAVKALKKCGRKALLIEPTGFESKYYCHDHDYEKSFTIQKKKKLSDKVLYLVDLTK